MPKIIVVPAYVQGVSSEPVPMAINVEHIVRFHPGQLNDGTAVVYLDTTGVRGLMLAITFEAFLGRVRG